MIYLLYQSPWPVGGSTSYTVHLAKVLGDAARVVRLGVRTERFKREIKGSGVQYQIVTLPDLLAAADAGNKILLTASSPKVPNNTWASLSNTGRAWATFHDPNEFKLYPHWQAWDQRRVICIRETGLDHMPGATFIPHPYVRINDTWPRVRTRAAVSIARTSSVKQSDMILDANAMLPESKRVALCGELNRMWYAHVLRKKYPNFTPSPGYPRIWGLGVKICLSAHYMVDLTKFDADGGGTQYTLLEAIDAGAVPVMSADWCSYPGPARKFGPAVASADELAAVLRVRPDPAQAARNLRYLQRVHDPAKIRARYLAALD